MTMADMYNILLMVKRRKKTGVKKTHTTLDEAKTYAKNIKDKINQIDTFDYAW